MKTTRNRTGTVLTLAAVAMVTLALATPSAQAGIIPTDVPGTILWLDETSHVKSGSNLTQWNDKSSAGGHHATLVTGQPVVTGTLNGLDVVTFDGNDALTYPSLGPLSGATVFVAATLTDNNQEQRPVVLYEDAGTGDYFIMPRVRMDGNNDFIGHAHSGGSNQSSDLNGDYSGTHIYAVTVQTSDVVVGSVDNVPGTAAAVGPTFSNCCDGLPDTRHIGSNRKHTGNFVVGDIAEIIVYDRKLTNDGTSDPAGNEFNAIGWYLQDKWGIAGNFVEPTAAAPSSTILSVDFSQGTDAPLQPGFQGFSFDDADPHTVTYLSAAATDGDIGVTISGQTHFRDYNTITGGPFLGLSSLLSDSVLRSANGVMTLTLGDLSPGTYEMTTYHHSTQYDDGLFDLYLTDALVTDLLMFGNVIIPDDSRAPTEITTLTFSFVSDGSDVLIEMDMTGGRHFKFNGFELSAVGADVIPEPATLSLLGLGALLALRRRRRSR